MISGINPNCFEVFRLHLPQQPISRHLAVFGHLTEPEPAPPETLGDDVFEPDERPAADEQDVGRVEGDAWLSRMLVAALRWHRGDRAFEHLSRACWTPSRISLKPEPLRLDFVDLVDVDDATLSNLHVAFGCLDQL